MPKQKFPVAIKKYLIDTVPLAKWLYRFKRNYNKRKAFARLSLEGVFTKIYKERLWYFGEQPLEVPYYSGTGSYGEAAEAYTRLVVDFVRDRNIVSMVDVGCGDFSIGKKITGSAPETLRYFGCDIVRDVIEYNNLKYGDSRITFLHLNACVDKLPQGDLLTIRQVLQHLSNQQITQIMEQAVSFKYVLITEHQLAEGLQQSYNADKAAGPDIRLARGSGVYLDKKPFSLSVKELLRCREDVNGSEAYIISYLLINNA
jgi:hypothetical protein